MYCCRGLPAKRGNGSVGIVKQVVGNLILEGNGKWDYIMLVELETLFETGLGVLLDQVILFLLRQQKAPGQLCKSRLSNLDRIRISF